MVEKAEEIDDSAPKFDGDNPQQWVLNIHTYFDLHKIPLSERLHIVEPFLTGGASQWYEWMKRHNFLHTWPDFLEKVQTCFRPPEFVHYRDQLSKLTQTGTVAQLQGEFEAIVENIVTGVSESVLVSCFVNVLRLDLKARVEAALPRTMAEAFAVARYYEEMMYGFGSGKDKCGTIVDPRFKKRKRLSTAEMKEKCQKGLCFNCHRQYIPKRPCPCKR